MKNTKGVIYILTNPSFKQYVKIGYADDLESRLSQLNRSECIPFAFRAYAVYEVEGRLTDLRLHDMIDQLNPDLRSIEDFDGKQRKREFYEMTAEEAYGILECIAEISGTKDRLKLMTPEGHEVLDEQRAEEDERNYKRKRFSFSEVGIMPGEELEFTEDPAIKVIVESDNRVKYNGEVYAMSPLAQKLTGKPSLQGPLFFKYKGERLTDLRMRKEIEKDNATEN